MQGVLNRWKERYSCFTYIDHTAMKGKVQSFHLNVDCQMHGGNYDKHQNTSSLPDFEHRDIFLNDFF